MKKFVSMTIGLLLVCSLCTTAFAAAGFTQNFEDGTVGEAAAGWSESAAVIATDPVSGEGNVLSLKTDEGSTMASFSPIDTTADVSFRFALGGTKDDTNQSKAAGLAIRLLNDGNEVVTLASVVSNSNGNYMNGKPSDKYNPVVLCMLKPAVLLQTGNTQASDIWPIATWLKEPTVPQYWWYVRMILDFDTATADVYVTKSGPITDDMLADPAASGLAVVEDFAFADSSIKSIDGFKVQVAHSSDARTICVDDISITGKGGSDPAPTATVEGIGASAQQDGQTGTLRFASKVTGEGIESFGASVLPVWIFDRDQGQLTNAEVVTIEQSIADGETYGIDVTDIPAGQFGTEIYAKPFIYVNGQPIWADAIRSSVNNAVTAQ